MIEIRQSSIFAALILSALLLTPKTSPASVASHWFDETATSENNIDSPANTSHESSEPQPASTQLPPVVPLKVTAPIDPTPPELKQEKKNHTKLAAPEKKSSKKSRKKSSKEKAEETSPVISEEEKLLGSRNADNPVDEPLGGAALVEQANKATEEDNKKFKDALEYVYANHPQIKAQREQVKIADEAVSQAVSGFRPNASANFSKGRERTGDIAQTWNYDNTKSRSLNVEQPIFSGGSSVSGFMAAKQRVKAARANLSATVQQVLYDAVVAYTDIVEKQSVLELNQQNVAVLQKQMDVTNARFKVGELTLTDISQAKARLAGAEASEKQALGDLEGARATFRRKIGYDVQGKTAMPQVPPGIPSTLTESLELAYRNNPILKAAHYNEQAAGDDVYVKGASILPTVSIQGTMSRADGTSLSALNQIDQDAIKLNINIPIYQSGAEWSRLREARNAAQQAKFNSFDTHESVVESVNIAWESFLTSKAIIVSNQAAVDAAETALNGVRKENEFGTRTILDVLNAEQETFSARVNLIQAIRTEKLQAYRLLATIGKLTAKDLGLKSQVEDLQEHYNSVKYQLLGL